MTQSLSTLIHLWMVCKALKPPMCTSFFHSFMRASNTPVPLYIGSHVWVINGIILACGQLSWICQMMAKLSSLSSTLIQLFEHHISFQCLVKNVFPRLFCSQTHLTHLLGSTSTNMQTTMHLRLLSDTS